MKILAFGERMCMLLTIFLNSPPQTDRFIADRSAMDFNVANLMLTRENSSVDVISPSKVRLFSRLYF